MQKTKLIDLLRSSGDLTLLFRDRAMAPAVVTTDFNNNYIRKKAKGNMKIPKKGILVWDWTNDMKRIINPNDVYKVIPLDQVLNNVRD